MILGKIWKAISAQFNKLGNWFSGYDPIAQMQYEYDRSVDQLREGREGLAQYRAWLSASPGKWMVSASRSRPSKPRSRRIFRREIGTPRPSSPSI